MSRPPRPLPLMSFMWYPCQLKFVSLRRSPLSSTIGASAWQT